VVAAFAAIFASGPAVFAQSLAQALESKYKPTTINAEGDIVIQGVTLVLQAGGLVAGPIVRCNSDFKDGKFSLDKISKATCSNASRIPGLGLIPGVGKVTNNTQVTRTFVAGEKLYDTNVVVGDDGIDFTLVSDFIPDVRYQSLVKVVFKKGSQPDLEEAEKLIARAFTVEAGGAAPRRVTSVTPAAPVFDPIAPPPPPPDAGRPLPTARPVKSQVPTPVPQPKPPPAEVLPPITPPPPPPDEPQAPVTSQTSGSSKLKMYGVGFGVLALLAVGALVALRTRHSAPGAPPPPPPPPFPGFHPPPPPMPPAQAPPGSMAAAAAVVALQASAPAPAPPAWPAEERLVPSPPPPLPPPTDTIWPPIQAVPAGPKTEDRVGELKVLLDLGVLNTDEFAVEHAKLRPEGVVNPPPAPDAAETRLLASDQPPPSLPHPDVRPNAVPAPEPAPTPPPPRSQPGRIALGHTMEQVMSVLGDPTNVVDLGARHILVYPSLKITFVDGVVSNVE
jgi:hypothetical protein